MGLTPANEALLIDALAVARLTRLVTADAITAGPRDAAIRLAYRRAGRSADLTEMEEWGSPGDAVEADAHPPKLAKLVTCPWCSSFWIAAGVIAARRVAPRQWDRLARALALSHVAGKLHG